MARTSGISSLPPSLHMQRRRWIQPIPHPRRKSRIKSAHRLEEGLKNWALLSVCLLFSALALPQTADQNSKTAVEHVLHVQQEAWNRHDLDAFMTGYWNSPDLTFFSGAKESKGWQATIDRYKATYTSPGHEMGKLDFSDLRVEILGPKAAF